MNQFKALYLLESVQQALKSSQEESSMALKISGLLNHLATFDVISPLDLKLPEHPDPLLAVANNLITRGTPTLPGIAIEDAFAEAFGFTQKIVHAGTIRHELKRKYTTEEFKRSLFLALHLIDPRAKHPADYLNTGDLDSSFERSFLLESIPKQHTYLSQLFEHQRQRNTLRADTTNQGRVDFSIEIPYDRIDTRTNRYNRSVEIKNKVRYIIETDGKRYHTNLVDDLKDFELASLKTQIRHIREDSAFQDSEAFLKTLHGEEYINAVSENFSLGIVGREAILQMVLSPALISRIQKVVLMLMLSQQETLKNTRQLKLLIVERDIPGASLAVSDLNELLSRLGEISEREVIFPKIECDVVPAKEFRDSPLHDQGNLIKSVKIDPESYDYIIDASVLRRTGIFKDDDHYNSSKTLLIRSSHFTQKQTGNPIISSNRIKYKAFTRHISNEQHEQIEETCTALTYFLNNLFRKEEFREGQLPILNRALQNQPVIGLLPTGGGKSLTYQLASLLQPGLTIVVDPIRSLMLDQYRGLRRAGIDRCEFINSTQTSEERRYVQGKALPAGNLQFVFVSPERFVIEEFRKTLEQTVTNGYYFVYCVIDEVHCVSEWGHDFRTPYLNLGINSIRYCRTIDSSPVTLFGLTATASFDVLADIERELQIPNDDGNALIRYENTVRDEINYRVLPATGDFKSIENPDHWKVREIIGDKKLEILLESLSTIQDEVHVFSEPKNIDKILRRSYSEYLPDFHRPEGEDFMAASLKKLETCEEDFTRDEGRNEFRYGTIVFCPHRTGSLGVKYFEGNLISALPGERIGYFMGSTDDMDAAKVDKESFENLGHFVDNKQSIMVATKAFGMGIDKPNVRATFHINIPQSIEAFVQEAGRAGRDQKLSISYILFNDQNIEVNGNPYNLDRDVLLYFHKNSFKGQIKERQTLHELRTKISFPNTNKLVQLAEYINEVYNQNGTEFIIEAGRNDYKDFLFVRTTENRNVGMVNLKKQEYRIRNDIGDASLCESILQTTMQSIPFSNYDSVDELRGWLFTMAVNRKYELGIETRLSEMKEGEKAIIQVPFTNRYYSVPKRSRKEFKLNKDHLDFFTSRKIIKELIEKSKIVAVDVAQALAESIYNGNTYKEFIDRLNIKDDVRAELSNHVDLERAYYIPRSEDDTAKGIYRLSSIGIIDTYTIDYQNKLYTLSFTKKKDEEYFNELERLFIRYTSAGRSRMLIDKVRNEYKRQKANNGATSLSICLKNLTEFVYDKIQNKRLQAINDMHNLCKDALMHNDPVEQSMEIKDHVYYYFNAKYSRDDYRAEVGEENIPASLPEDREKLGIGDTIWKYIEIIDIDDSGELKNNIKHLRGAAMRMLRSYPNEPHYLILKAFALIILSDVTPVLATEGIREMSRGLVEWKGIEAELDIVEMLSKIKQKILEHIELENIEEVFNDIEDHVYAEYYAGWTSKFSEQFLNNY